MYERFTDRARKVMQLANQEAQRFNHEYVGTEHVLLGLVKEGSGVAANVLKNLDISLLAIQLKVEQIVQHGPGSEKVFKGRRPHTPRTQKAIEYAIEEARNLNQNYVGSEHLLLGLLHEESVAGVVLIGLGLTLERTREEIRNLLDHSLPKAKRETPRPTPGRPEPLDAAQLLAVRERLKYLAEQKELFLAAQNFEDAVRVREEETALARLLAWYEWFRTYP